MNLPLQLALLSVLGAVLAASQKACFDKSQTAPVSAADLGAASTDFAIDLFKNVMAKPTGPEDNVFISPISVWSALTMTYLGCAGNTQHELAAALNLRGLDPAVVADGYRDLKDNHLNHAATESANYTFRLANRLYFEQTVPIRLTCINDQLSGEIQKVDFVGASQPSRIQINDWVAKQTNNKIVDLLPADYVTPQTTLVIVNAAYFIGYWEHQFTEGRTLPNRDFFVRPDRSIKVKMMTREGRYRLRPSSADLGYSAIELPYSGQEVSMIVVLPDAGVEIADVVAKFNPDVLGELQRGMQMTNVQLELPKFKVEQTMELKEPVQQLGVNDLFDAGAANLTGFTDAAGNYVNFIRHKTYIDVNEGGTEAAAATAVGVTRLSAITRPDPVKFVVDRPFLLFIRNNKLNTILFMGCIKTPTQN